MKVFLGGTVNGSTWREYIMPKLKIDYFNPVVANWNEEAYKRELHEREHSEYCLYVVTPRMTGYYSLAEVVDDSYKRADRTIYCFLPEDDEFSFTKEQIVTLESLGQLISANGAIWQKSLDDVIAFLNKASRNEDDTGIVDEFNDVFISYGRRHSLAFARKLYNNLRSKGHSVWFDMNDIPLGVDFQEQIDNGIRKAQNFVFVISPHSVKSVYCYKEIVLALKYNKRIIPILHVEPTDCWDKMHPAIGKLNWIYCRQTEDFSVPLEEWQYTDNFDNAFSGLISLINKHKNYVYLHTTLLDKAMAWEASKRKRDMLLVGEERDEAQSWLIKSTTADAFKNEQGIEEQAPCHPNNLHAEFICESIKNGQNLMTKVFMMYDRVDLIIKEQIRHSLNLHAITTWSDTTDIASGVQYENAIEHGMEGADNVVFLLSKNSIHSTYCVKELGHAFKYNKRVIPLLLDPIETIEGYHNFPELAGIQYIDFTDRRMREEVEVKDHSDVEADVNARKEKTPYEKSLDKLIGEIETESRFYEQHKMFLVQALRWTTLDQAESFLLRGYNLENALTWVKTAQQMPHKPIELHKTFIDASFAKAGMLSSEIFLSYSRKDGDFARKLNIELQTAGKTTWFDQESIASSSDFQAEIYNGIETSDNFVFVITPNSVSSIYCEDEVNYAEKHGKRFVSILLQDTEIETIPEALRKVQWIDFKNNNFVDAFAELIRVLDTDRDYVKSHSHWQHEARTWRDKSRPEDLLLRGTEFEAAEAWLDNATNEGKKPVPTELQHEFIRASGTSVMAALRRAKQQRIIKRLLVAAVVMAVFLLIFGIYAFNQKREAEIQREEAHLQAQKAKEEEGKALEAKALADSLKQLAELSADTAKMQKEEAVKQKRIADMNTVIAMRNKQLAEEQKAIAEEERNKAKDAEKNARDAQAATEVANEKAVFQLYEFNAFNFASNAVMSQGDNVQRDVLMSLTAFELKEQARIVGLEHKLVPEYDPVVLNSLQKSVLSNESNRLLNGEIWTQQFNNGRLACSNAGGKLLIGSVKMQSDKILPKLSTQEISTEMKPSAVVLALAYSPDGKKLAYGTSEGGMFLYDFETKNSKSLPVSTRMALVSAAFSPDGKFLFYGSNDKSLTKLNLTDNSSFIIDNSEVVVSIAMPDNQNLFCVSSSGKLKIFDFEDGAPDKQWVEIQNSGHKFSKIIYSPYLKMLIAGTQKGELLGIYTNTNNAQQWGFVNFPAKHGGMVSDIAFSHDSRWLASGSYDGTMLLWDLTKGIKQSLPVVINSGNRILSLSFDTQSKYVIYADNKNLNILPVNEADMYHSIRKITGDNTLSTEDWNYYKRGEINKPDRVK